ncbi:MAG: protein kinase [Gomphosphaeria aponina SAG 52.96 = DSM 107014]|uniref:non-specific serine/threonine protein kinase n=1 Tax=Gomphosphaeria aponina SAG 52.96 = DSM 107014 TaxID=1521640 RepID=A0A941GNS0_9CHRO|nr:protein kinase [Gomphosphaeria aponina SAG 52.96 = DSM 107014]
MNNLPNFLNYGYEIIEELGRNREGGRITWKGKKIETNTEVVIKQFCFASAGSSWSGFKAYEREIQVLQNLNHPGIPRYLGSFPTENGFCLLQEYINAPSLAVSRSFEPENIKTIAIKILEILVYLQHLIPPIIHQDLKPENILVDNDLNVYVIDFGFARIGTNEVANSSMIKGTPGFISPEQVRKPTEASDLYSLGATLICLLTGKKSTEIQDLTGENNPYKIEFQHLLPRLSLRFIQWLAKMVEPSQKDRYKNAAEALETLKPLYVIRYPEVQRSQSELKFQANQIGEKIPKTVTLTNSIPETVLEGELWVAPHPNDPPHTPDTHTWISLTPKRFTGNKAEIRITVDTSKLLAAKVYQREMILRTNAVPETLSFIVKVQTAAFPIEKKKIPYLAVALILIIATALGWFLSSALGMINLLFHQTGQWLDGNAILSFFVVIAIVGFFIILLGIARIEKYNDRLIFYLSLFGALGFFASFVVLEFFIKANIIQAILAMIACTLVGFVLAWLLNGLVAIFHENTRQQRLSRGMTPIISLLTIGMGMASGIGFNIGFLNPYILLALAGTSLPLAIMILYPQFKQAKLIAKYRKAEKEQHLIQP